MKKRLIAFLRRFLKIEDDRRNLNERLNHHYTVLSSDIAQLNRIIKQHIDISVDVHARQGSYIVLCGRFRGRDHVQIIDLGDREFAFIVEQMREMSKYAEVRYVDSPKEMRPHFFNSRSI